MSPSFLTSLRPVLKEMVERAFRSLKSIDLNVRPIYHHLEDRVRSHIFICMLAYHVEHWMRKKLAPVLFAEEDKVSANQRTSVVAPVTRSQAANKKDNTKSTAEEEYHISSFRDILTALSGLTRAQVIVSGHKKGDHRYRAKDLHTGAPIVSVPRSTSIR